MNLISRKLSILFLAVGITAGFTSCEKDKDEVPTLTLTANSTTVAPGDPITLAINAGSNNNLDKVTIDISTNGGAFARLDDTTFSGSRNVASYNYVYNNTNQNQNNDRLAFKVTVLDKKSLTISKEVAVTVTSGLTLKECTNIALGAQNASNGSAFGTSNCGVYTVGTAPANASNIDFIFFYGSTNNASIASPSNTTVFGTGSGQISSLGVQNYSPRNDTKIKKTGLSATEYNNASQNSLETLFTSTPAASSDLANNLSSGDVLVFQTAGGKYGILIVNSITGNDANAEANVSTKVQL